MHQWPVVWPPPFRIWTCLPQPIHWIIWPHLLKRCHGDDPETAFNRRPKQRCRDPARQQYRLCHSHRGAHAERHLSQTRRQGAGVGRWQHRPGLGRWRVHPQRRGPCGHRGPARRCAKIRLTETRRRFAKGRNRDWGRN